MEFSNILLTSVLTCLNSVGVRHWSRWKWYPGPQHEENQEGGHAISRTIILLVFILSVCRSHFVSGPHSARMGGATGLHQTKWSQRRRPWRGTVHIQYRNVTNNVAPESYAGYYCMFLPFSRWNIQLLHTPHLMVRKRSRRTWRIGSTPVRSPPPPSRSNFSPKTAKKRFLCKSQLLPSIHPKLLQWVLNIGA